MTEDDNKKDNQGLETQNLLNDEDFTIEHINFECLNIIYACLQGQFAALNVLKQTIHPEFNPEDIQGTKDFIQEINKYIDSFFAGQLPINPQSENITEQEERIFILLEAIKQCFIIAADHIVQVAQKDDWKTNPANYQLLVAYYSLYAYCEENYYKKLLDYYVGKRLDDFIPQVQMQVYKADNDIKLVSIFLKSLKNPDGPEEEFFPHLMFFVKTLPGYCYAKIHDVNQLRNIKAEEFTYKLAEFSNDEAKEWYNAEYDAISAGYWRAYSFTPKTASEWREKGFISASDAAGWLVAGFESEEAVKWAQFMFTPLLAVQWKQTEYHPEQAAILISHGIHMPGNLPDNPELIQEMLDEGFKQS